MLHTKPAPDQDTVSPSITIALTDTVIGFLVLLASLLEKAPRRLKNSGLYRRLHDTLLGWAMRLDDGLGRTGWEPRFSPFKSLTEKVSK